MEHRLSPGRQTETETLHHLLDICDNIDIPFSFDVVGHLLLESCDGSHDGPHPSDWFDIDPGTNVSKNPKFYAPDLIQAIDDAEVEHEICTHTFSHVECDQVSPEVVDWELKTACEAHEEFGLTRPETMVPPRHSPPPREVLRANNIEMLRKPHYYAPEYDRPSVPRKAFEILFGSHPTLAPQEKDGVIESYSTEYGTIAATYLARGTKNPLPVFKIIPKRVRRRLHIRKLQSGWSNAAATNSYVHFWSHLHDLAHEDQWPQLEDALYELADLRDRGDVEIVTMAQLNNLCRE